MVLNSALCEVTLQLEVIQAPFSSLSMAGLVSQNEKKESIDVDDFFKENALRRRNEKPYSFCEGHIIFYNVRGFSVNSALTKGMELMKKKGRE